MGLKKQHKDEINNKRRKWKLTLCDAVRWHYVEAMQGEQSKKRYRSDREREREKIARNDRTTGTRVIDVVCTVYIRHHYGTLVLIS